MAKTNSKRTVDARIPAVGYIRMSTDKQEDSPEQQRAEIIKLAKREGYRIIRWYEDHNISGAKTLKRKQFQQMIRDAESGDFKAILCWDQDRFGRFDSIEAGEWISPLRRAGVALVSVVQGHIDWEDFAGRMMYQITQEGKHRYLVDLSKNVLRGMIRFAQQGHLLGYPTPYGYERQYFDASGKEMCRIRRGEKFHKPRHWLAKLVPSSDTEEVKIVQWLFKTYADTDRSARSLAVELNRRGVTSPNGCEWDHTHIKTILRNPTYAGWLTYGRRGAGLYFNVGPDAEIVSANGRREPRNHDRRHAPVVVKDNHEGLVDQATFDRVQEKLKARSKVKGGPCRRYLLAGLLRCGHCGSILVSTGIKVQPGKKGARQGYYRCKRSHLSGTCKSYGVRMDFIEPFMLEKFREVWQSKEGQKALRQAIRSIGTERDDTTADEVKALRKKLVKIEKQVAKGTKNLLLLDPKDVPAASALLAEWRDEHDQIVGEIEALEARQEESKPLDPEAVIAELDELGEHLTSDDIPLARTAFKRLFESVTLFWQQVSPRRKELVRAEIKARFPFV